MIRFLAQIFAIGKVGVIAKNRYSSFYARPWQIALTRHRFGIHALSKYVSMNQYEVLALISDEFPETNKDICYLSAFGNVYQTMSVFSQFMRKKVTAHQFSKVFKCMKLADYIYVHGDAVVRNAVENAFVYSFSQASQYCDKKEWEIVKAHIPARLYTFYIKQVIGYGS